jgi:hypothetical protein
MVSIPPALIYLASSSVSTVCGAIPKKPGGAWGVGRATPCAPPKKAARRAATTRRERWRRFIEFGKVAGWTGWPPQPMAAGWVSDFDA